MKQSDMHGFKRFLRPIAYGIVSGIAAGLILLIFMSIVMVLQDIPDSVSSGCSREKGLLLGLVCGMCLFAILSLASLAIYGGDFGMAALTKFIAALLAAAFGGVIGVNRRKKCR